MSTWLKSQTRRIKQQTLQGLGVAKQTKDPIFDAYVSRFSEMQEGFERVREKFQAYEHCLEALSKASSELNAELHIFCATSSKVPRKHSGDAPKKSGGSDLVHKRHQSAHSMSSALADPSFLDRSSRACQSDPVDHSLPSLLNVVNYMQAAHISMQYSVVDIVRKVFSQEITRPLQNLSVQMERINRKIKDRQVLMLDYDHYKRIEENANSKGKLSHISENALNLSTAEKAVTDITRSLKETFQALENRRSSLLAPQVAAFLACELHSFQRSNDYLYPVIATFPEVAGSLARLSSETHKFHSRIRENRKNPRFALISEAIVTATEGRLPPTFYSGKDAIQLANSHFHDVHHTHRLRWTPQSLALTSFQKLHTGAAPDTQAVSRPSSVPLNSLHVASNTSRREVPPPASSQSASGGEAPATIHPPERHLRGRGRGFERSITQPPLRNPKIITVQLSFTLTPIPYTRNY